MIILSVNYIHSKGIIHRNINPSNILVTNESNTRELLKLGGFGHSIQEGDHLLTNFIDIFGADSSPNFMAPEQTRGEDPSTKSDVWACGAIFYYLATFKLPFEAPNRYAIQENIRTHDIKVEELSEEFRCVIEKMLIKDHKVRPSIKEVMEMTLTKKAIKLFMEEIYCNNALFNDIFKWIYKVNMTYFDRIYNDISQL